MYSCPPIAECLSIPATYLSVAIALPDSEPPDMCVYISIPEERSSDDGTSNILPDDRCFESIALNYLWS